MRQKENFVQSAISNALQVYCAQRGHPHLQQFPPYANQQGTGLRKYCTDIVGLLDDARVLLLEVKARDCALNLLREFKPEQHEKYIQFQDIGVPIAYAYNSVSLLEYFRASNARSEDWAAVTLAQIKRTVPRDLPNDRPNYQAHGTLLQWLTAAQGGNALAQFGQIHGVTRSLSDLRNGFLVLVYGVSQHCLASLTLDQMNTVIKTLERSSSLNASQFSALQRILGESAAVFSRFQQQIPQADDEEEDDDSPRGPRNTP